MADDNLRQTCIDRVKEIFGQEPQQGVRDRLEFELNAICKNGHAGLFMFWSSLVSQSKKMGYPVGTRGSVASSLVAYLCGITEINPLSAEYGGCDIPSEVFMGLNFDKEPDINICFAPDVLDFMQDYVMHLPVVGDACFGGTIDTLKIKFLCYPPLNLIHELQNLTGLSYGSIPMEDVRVLDFLLDTEIEKIEGLPEFGNEVAREVIREVNPKTYDDLIRISTLMHGSDTWWLNQRELVLNNEISLGDCITSRDDIYLALIGKGMDKKYAYQVMDSVRKGKGLTEDMVEKIKQAGMPDWYVGACMKIKYLFPKAHAASCTLTAWRIAYYMINYPKEYKEAVHGQISDV